MPSRFLLKLRSAGMFSNVNEVVDQVHRAIRGGYEFSIDWSRSPYRQEGRDGDPWSYYFEAPFEGGGAEPQQVLLMSACRRDNIMTPRLYDRRCEPLLPPLDRSLTSRIIARYIRLKPRLRRAIEVFQAREFVGRRILGIHARGTAKRDGGLRLFVPRSWTREDLFRRFVDQIREVRRKNSFDRLFLCSDSSWICDRFRQEFGLDVLVFDSIRTPEGEMHASRGIRNRYKLGADVIAEAWLLSVCDYLIHGISNVSNFALGANASLRHRCVFPVTFGMARRIQLFLAMTRSGMFRAGERFTGLRRPFVWRP